MLRRNALYLLSQARGFLPRHHDQIEAALGAFEGLLTASEQELCGIGLTGGQLQRLQEARAGCDPAADLAAMAARGISVVGWGEADYPELLAEVEDAPLLLYCLGDTGIMRHHGIGIVGSRKCTERGLEIARHFGADLAGLGIPVVSGMAAGVDGAAHGGTLDAGGPTVAVLGCGVDVAYPPQHHQLHAELAEQGLIVSEYPPGSEPRRENFPQRNRIISGLSLGVIVVEAAESSGALVTARHAGEQGREVFAVPGPVDSRMSRGCHQLIRDGAKLVESAEDVLEELGPLVAPAPVAEGQSVHRPAELLLNEQESLVLNAVGTSPGSVDAVISACGLPTPQVLATLSVLEMRRLVRRMTGNQIVRL
jgi:DNA processing protein